MVCIWLGAGHSEASGKKLQPPLACLQKYNIHKSIQKDKCRNTNVQCGPGVKIACSHLCSVNVTFRHLKAGAICIVVVCKVVFFQVHNCQFCCSGQAHCVSNLLRLWSVFFVHFSVFTVSCFYKEPVGSIRRFHWWSMKVALIARVCIIIGSGFLPQLKGGS